MIAVWINLTLCPLTYVVAKSESSHKNYSYSLQTQIGKYLIRELCCPYNRHIINCDHNITGTIASRQFPRPTNDSNT